MKLFSESELGQLSQVIPNPGTSLIHNPFGDRVCYFYGLFYPFADSAILECAQRAMIQNIQDNHEAWVFFGQDVTAIHILENDINQFLLSSSLENEALRDINVFMPKTRHAFCISQEERFVLSTFDPLVICKNDDFDCNKFTYSTKDSVYSIYEHVRLLKLLDGNRVKYDR